MYVCMCVCAIESLHDVLQHHMHGEYIHVIFIQTSHACDLY